MFKFLERMTKGWVKEKSKQYFENVIFTGWYCVYYLRIVHFYYIFKYFYLRKSIINKNKLK